MQSSTSVHKKKQMFQNIAYHKLYVENYDLVSGLSSFFSITKYLIILFPWQSVNNAWKAGDEDIGNFLENDQLPN